MVVMIDWHKYGTELSHQQYLFKQVKAVLMKGHCNCINVCEFMSCDPSTHDHEKSTLKKANKIYKPCLI